jgi:hypothetical protein
MLRRPIVILSAKGLPTITTIAIQLSITLASRPTLNTSTKSFARLELAEEIVLTPPLTAPLLANRLPRNGMLATPLALLAQKLLENTALRANAKLPLAKNAMIHLLTVHISVSRFLTRLTRLDQLSIVGLRRRASEITLIVGTLKLRILTRQGFYWEVKKWPASITAGRLIAPMISL